MEKERNTLNQQIQEIETREQEIESKLNELRELKGKNEKKVEHLNGLIEIETKEVHGNEIPIDNYQDETKLVDDELTWEEKCIQKDWHVYDDDCLSIEDYLKR